MIDIDDDDPNFEIVPGLDGRPVKILRDGGRIRVSMSARDSLSLTPLQRSVADAALADQRRGRRVKYDPAGRLVSWEEEETDDALPVHDGRGNPCGHRPGFLITTDQRARAAKLRAYHDADVAAQNAWRNPPTGFGSRGPRGQQAGDLCTIDGAPGHLQLRGGELVCVPDRRSDRPDPASDHRTVAQRVADHARVMEREYSLYNETVTNLWRDPT
jgi:hypothetical protein